MPDPREEEETPTESCRQGSSLDTDRCTHHRMACNIRTTSSMMGSGLAASSWSFTLSSTRWRNKTSISAGLSSRTPRKQGTGKLTRALDLVHKSPFEHFCLKSMAYTSEYTQDVYSHHPNPFRDSQKSPGNDANPTTIKWHKHQQQQEVIC